MVVRADAPPTVAFVDPNPATESKADDVLAAEVSARDDLAVAAAELHYAIQRKGSGTPETSSTRLELAGLGTRRARGEAGLDLKPLGLRPGDVLSYRVKVLDNRPGPDGPNVGWTPIRLLSIVEKADPMVARRAAAERSDIQAQLDALKRLAASNKQAGEQLRYAADAAQRGNGKWDSGRDRALKEREAGAREVIERLETLAKTVESHPLFAPMARPARQAARVEGEGAREVLDRAVRAADDARRLAELRQADARLGSVQVRIDELQRQFEALSKLEDDRRKLAALARKQEDLSKRAAELAADPANKGGDRARLDQVRNEQQRLEREVNELARQSPALKADILAAQAREAARLAEEARKLAERQRAEARKTAEIDRDDPRLRALLEAQRNLEDDARRLAMRVDEPLGQNGRSRLNVEALRAPEEPIARADVAQARQALENGENELRRLSRDLDDVRDDPKALAQRLARRQDELRNQARETINQNVQDRNKPTDPERRRLAEALKPLAEREEAIRRLAAQIPVPDNLKDAARRAVEKTEKATENLRNPAPNQADQRQNEAFDALQNLANALPDINQRRNQAIQAFNQARGKADEVARELERHLRETAPQTGRPHDPDAAAAELTRRIAPLAARQEEVAEALAKLPVDLRAEPQRDRLAGRARRLADAIDAVREQLPRDPKMRAEADPAADWHLIGPFAFESQPPFSADRPVDLKAVHEGPEGREGHLATGAFRGGPRVDRPRQDLRHRRPPVRLRLRRDAQPGEGARAARRRLGRHADRLAQRPRGLPVRRQSGV